jgi:secreted trypsin-like serine protease
MGDSGGSFAMERNGRWFLRGVVSFGYTGKGLLNGTEAKVCSEKMPSLYFDLADQMEWVKQNAAPLPWWKKALNYLYTV